MAEVQKHGDSSSEADRRLIAVVGCGVMGRGIAEACARAGLRVVAVKATPGPVDKVRESVLRGLDGQVKKGKLDAAARDTIIGRITFATELSAIAAADIIIESGLEAIAAKQQLLSAIERVARPDAILATNTSSLSLSEIADGLARPERFLGLHFFSPAVMMKLCEVAPTERTDPEVVKRVTAFVESIDKTPVLVGDQPGYIVNRLLVPYLLLAMHTLEEGVASAESIDAAMRLGCGHPIGPLALADYIGLDVVFAMAKSMGDAYRDPRYKVPSILRRLVLDNHLGKKSSAGFYLYEAAGSVRPNPTILTFSRSGGGLAAAE